MIQRIHYGFDVKDDTAHAVQIIIWFEPKSIPIVPILFWNQDCTSL